MQRANDGYCFTVDFNLRANNSRVLRNVYMLPPDGQSRRLSDGHRAVESVLSENLEITHTIARFQTGTDLTVRASSVLRFVRDTWLILPVAICLSQRLSHACLSSAIGT